MWTKLDDGYFRNRKSRAAGKDGRLLDLAGFCWASGHGTDGHIADTDLPLVAAEAGVKPSVAQRLVAVGRWERVDDGYQIHDFLLYNPTAAEVEERRKKRAEAGRLGGKKSRPPRRPRPAQTPDEGEASAQADAQASASALAQALAQAKRKQNGTPSPSPTTCISRQSLQVGAGGPTDDDIEAEADRRLGEAMARQEITNPDAYRASIVTDLRLTHWRPEPVAVAARPLGCERCEDGWLDLDADPLEPCPVCRPFG